MSHSRWNLLPRIPDKHELIRSGFSPVIAQILFNRGLNSRSEAETFFNSDDKLNYDPFLLPGMSRATTRIFKALLSGESIAVYGDFDTDGITATAIMVQGLSILGCKAIPYIPHRLTEGYGLKVTALENLRNQGINLVISVDCGITAIAEVKNAKRMGLDIIITDHHMPNEQIPEAVAVINPKLPDSLYPFSELSGAGVALKLVQALLKGVNKEDELEKVLDLVALGTVADMVPLLGENRFLAIQGLKKLCISCRPGIKEMIKGANMEMGNLNAESISWMLAPRLNAAGRLDHAMRSYNLLTTESDDEAREMAAWLEGKNLERQRLTTKALEKAREQVGAAGVSPLLMIGDPDYPQGIVGLVAGRLVEEFYRPAIVVKTGEQTSTGSCRSIPEFNIAQALSKYSHLMTRFGGHAQAAGFSLPTRNLPLLEAALREAAAVQLEGVDLRPRLNIDVEAKLSDLGGNNWVIMQKLSPFGTGNPAPTFLSRGVVVAEARTMGSSGEHMRFKFKQGNVSWQGVGFGLGGYFKEITSPLDIVYGLEVDTWNGQGNLRLNIVDFQPAT